MKMTFRWYGPKDPVTLDMIRQIPGMTGVVTALYTIPVGQVWDLDSILALKKQVTDAGLEMEVIESVPVHEEIKLGSDKRDALIDNYIQTIRNLAKAGVKVICYNFMPVFDWVRSDLHYNTKDGSNCLAYSQEQIDAIDPKKQSLSLPGWDESYTKEELQNLLKRYEAVDEEKLFDNMVYFLKRLMPVCEECDVKMAVHPDDPPWSLFGLPRIVRDEAHLDRLFSAVDSKYNGLTLCTGSLGADRNNDLVKMAAKYAKMGRVHFLHARNIKFTNTEEGHMFFHESPHPTECGSLDMYGILKALHDNGFEGYTRPDHGRNIWGEERRPGYGLYDRALGATYLYGVWEAIDKSSK
ncbi:MAG: mannonate dehydratase [Clostridia bacterium]|nr:mannonate dehydratase [Clostridia bacterium]